jgi:hypothetical protein
MKPDIRPLSPCFTLPFSLTGVRSVRDFKLLTKDAQVFVVLNLWLSNSAATNRIY